MFPEKWKMIQERSYQTKVDEYYHIESVRKNENIESKCFKEVINSGTFKTIESL